MSLIQESDLDSESLQIAMDLLETLRANCERDGGRFEFLLALCALTHAANLVTKAASEALGNDRARALLDDVERYAAHVVRDFDVVEIADREPGTPLAAVLAVPRKPGKPS